MTTYNNLPASISADATIQAFDNYYVKPIQLNAGTFDAIRGFFNSKGFDQVSSETITTAIMKQAQLGNYNPMQVLDSIKGLTNLELGNLIAEIMNYTRFKTSLLGSTVTSNPYTEITRNILA